MTQPIYDEQILSDLHKDARGFRPREYFWSWWNAATVEERNAEWSMLILEVEASIREDEEREELAEDRWNDLVIKTMKAGARDEVVAVRWLVEALPDSQRQHGAGYVAYCNGWPKAAEASLRPFCYGRA